MKGRWVERGRGFATVAVLAVIFTGIGFGPAVGAGGGDVTNNIPRPLIMEMAPPPVTPDMAQRQAMGCTVVGLGLTGVAMMSGALATAGAGGVPVGAAFGEIVTYFGTGCTIGAFLAGLFPSEAESEAQTPPPVSAINGIGG